MKYLHIINCKLKESRIAVGIEVAARRRKKRGVDNNGKIQFRNHQPQDSMIDPTSPD